MRRAVVLALVLAASPVLAQTIPIAGGGGSSAITSGTTTITGGTSGSPCYNNAGVADCADSGWSFNGTTNALTATTFVGALTGTASGNLVSGGALGTPSSGTATNITGLPLAGITGFGAGVATLLGGASSGTGGPAGTTSPTFTTPVLGVATGTSLALGGALPANTQIHAQAAAQANVDVETTATNNVGVFEARAPTGVVFDVYATGTAVAGNLLGSARAGQVSLYASGAGLTSLNVGTATSDPVVISTADTARITFAAAGGISSSEVLTLTAASGKLTNSAASAAWYVTTSSTGNSVGEAIFGGDDGLGRYMEVGVGSNGYNGTPLGQTGANIAFITAAGASVTGLAIGTSTADPLYLGTNAATNLTIASGGAITITSTFVSSATSNIGWTPVTGANTACNTTCTSACVFGTDAVTGGILACTDATADVCLCAGSS